MKTTFVSIAGVCLAAALGMGAQTATAATADLLKVKLPYASQVGAMTLPAGNWTVSDLQDAGSSAVLLFRAEDGTSVEVMAERVEAPKHPGSSDSQVTLQRTGDGYRVEKIWFGNRNYGYELPVVKTH